MCTQSANKCASMSGKCSAVTVCGFSRGKCGVRLLYTRALLQHLTCTACMHGTRNTVCVCVCVCVCWHDACKHDFLQLDEVHTPHQRDLTAQGNGDTEMMLSVRNIDLGIRHQSILVSWQHLYLGCGFGSDCSPGSSWSFALNGLSEHCTVILYHVYHRKFQYNAAIVCLYVSGNQLPSCWHRWSLHVNLRDPPSACLTLARTLTTRILVKGSKNGERTTLTWWQRLVQFIMGSRKPISRWI